jgi:hypothetical protein
MRRNDLSLTTAAEALGLSRRMVSDYRTAQRPIPKPLWLARLGAWDMNGSDERWRSWGRRSGSGSPSS